MGIIKYFKDTIKKLKEENLILKERLRLIEIRLESAISKMSSPSIQHLTPEITKTLDANNLWMGEKGANTYDKMAKLDVYYDEIENLWKARGEGIVDTVEFTYDVGSGTWKSTGVIPQIIISTYPGKSLLKTAEITDDGEEKTVFFSLPIYAEYYPG